MRPEEVAVPGFEFQLVFPPPQTSSSVFTVRAMVGLEK